MKAIRSFVFMLFLMLMASCGPVINILEVDVRLPAAKPLPLLGKQLAVFIPVYDSVSVIDSVLLNKFSQALAEELALLTHLPEGAVPLYSHRTEDAALGTLEQPDYVYRLAVETESDMVFMVDSVTIGNFETLRQYLILPFQSVVRVFDAETFEFPEYTVLYDTLAWELRLPYDANTVTIPPAAYEDILRAAAFLGQRTARSYVDQWETQDRVVFVYDRKDWNKAYDYALAFEWDKAMHLWMELLDAGNEKEIACAAFNIALACEMQGHFDLAEEWLDLSARTFAMQETQYYAELLSKRKKRTE